MNANSFLNLYFTIASCVPAGIHVESVFILKYTVGEDSMKTINDTQSDSRSELSVTVYYSKCSARQ